MMKRSVDIVGSATALLLLSPVMLGIAAGVAIRIGRPILFRQRRPGLNGQPFDMVKFRTMNDSRSSDGLLLPDGERLVPFGRFLRVTSLDELPGFWNVLKGDMSLVGPRPLLTRYLSRYTPQQARRHEVRPGLTGLAQVSGRNALSWDDKFALDIWYVDHRTVWLDVKILLLTAWKVLRRESISAAGEATMSEFLGPAPREGDRR